MSPSPWLSVRALQITYPLMEQRIPSSCGYLRCSLSQQGLIHQSRSSDTHITPHYIQMELPGNSNVLTSWCLLCAAFSGQWVSYCWTFVLLLRSIWLSISSVSSEWGKRIFLQQKEWRQKSGRSRWEWKENINYHTVDVLNVNASVNNTDWSLQGIFQGARSFCTVQKHSFWLTGYSNAAYPHWTQIQIAAWWNYIENQWIRGWMWVTGIDVLLIQHLHSLCL